jgi:tetratricopeptide (TPR) repeat protein
LQTDISADPQAVLARVEPLYSAGAFLQAHRAAQSLGDLRRWPGPDGQLLGARLASQLGDARLGDALLLRALRKWPEHPRVLFFGAMALDNSRGPLAAIELIESRRHVLDSRPAARAECIAFLAFLYAFLRDFETARALMAPLVDQPVSSWILSQLAAIHELEDDYDSALAAARRGLQIDPSSRSAIQYVARFLSLQERDGEAIALLRDALQRVEAARIAGQLADLEIETHQPEAALRSLDRYDELTPMKGRRTRAWLAARRCDAYHSLGERAQAIEQARLADTPFYRSVAQQLETAGPGERRVMLPVGFVRQHHMTCAPATLSALSRYWSCPAQHLEVAEEICYDGTPHHSERRWAVENSWYPREFTVTWAATRGLIDAGIPFTLTTVQPDSAHMQAVIGYDGTRGTLLIRDPYERTYGEFAQAAFFESAAANGPRGMALVPAADNARLDAVELPEVELHDLLHELQSALVRHDRDRALETCAALEARAPGHRLAIGARRSVAIYDGDEPAILAATERLLAAYPGDLMWSLSKAASLRALAPRGEALAWLGSLALKAGSHSLAKLRYAQMLLEDDRQRGRAVRLLARVLALSPRSAAAYSALGDACWQSGNYSRAVFCYRLAAAVDSTDEGHALAYFRSARAVREQERAIGFLKSRLQRLGNLSPQPAVTVYKCLDELERTPEALQVLEAALARHPDDGSLLLFAARAFADRGDAQRAGGLLEQARGRSRRAQWLQTAARIAEAEARLADALGLAADAAAIEPLDLDLQRNVARLRRDVEGRAAALGALRALVERFPHHHGLNELLAEWLEGESLAEREAGLRRLLDLNPANAWAQRELGWVLSLAQRHEEARAALEVARALAPNSVALYRISGQLYARAGNLAQARAEYRRAIEISVDDDYAIRRLVESCNTLEERRGQLEFVVGELKRQVIYGDGVLTFQSVANTALQPQEVLDLLENAHAVRPDLWQTWIARVRQLVRMQQMSGAAALCDQAVQRFPHLPRAHLERAEILRLTADRNGEQQALREALRLSPGWPLAARQLAESLEAQRDFSRSREVLERALRHYPSDAYLHGYLGDALWHLGEREAAIAQLALAVDLDPEYEWAWHSLESFCAQAGDPQQPRNLAREIAARRPGDARTWRALAIVADNAEERLAAYQGAIAASPLALAAHEAKLDLLISEGRHDEVLAAAEDKRWGEQLPVSLTLRVARATHAKGDVGAAIAALEAALADDPNVLAAWEHLADWRRERGDFTGYLAAAKEMSRIAPNDPICLGYLAHAQLRVDPGAGVDELLQRALALKPDYEYAAFELVDRALEAGEPQRAEQILDGLSHHSAAGGIGLRRIRLAGYRRDRAAALARLRELLLRHADADTAQGALSELDRWGWKAEGERSIDALALDPRGHADLGTLWVTRRQHRRATPWQYAGLAAVLANPVCAQPAARAYLRSQAKRSSLRVRLFVWRHAQLLARDDETHALVGYALLEAGAAHAVAAWFRRFPPRPGTPGWGLLNLVAALFETGREEEAARWSRAALDRAADHAAGSHRSWLALHAARTGNLQEAQSLLQQCEGAEPGTYYQFVHCLTRALIAAASLPAAPALETGMNELRRARALLPGYRNDRVLGRLASDTVRAIAGAGAGGNAALGAWLAFKIWWSL